MTREGGRNDSERRSGIGEDEGKAFPFGKVGNAKKKKPCK